ncbi:MAG: hypothetical protein AAB861_01420, partial [Patescibacteria group bacterium]
GSREEIQISGTATLVMLPAPTPAEGGVGAPTESVGAGARIKFDESFISAISETEPIKVIVTPTTRLNGSLYVSRKSRFGFEIREINSQDEGGMFDWIVIARKRGGEDTATIGPIGPIGPIENPATTPPTEPVVPPAETVAPPAEVIPPATEPTPPPAEVTPPPAETVTPTTEPTIPPPAESPPPPPAEETPPPPVEEPVIPPAEAPPPTP